MNIPLRGMCLLGFLYHTVVTGREHNTYNNIRVKITILIHRIPDLSQHVQCMCLAPHDTWCFSNAPSIFLSFSVSTFPSEYYLETAVSITMHNQSTSTYLSYAVGRRPLTMHIRNLMSGSIDTIVYVVYSIYGGSKSTSGSYES